MLSKIKNVENDICYFLDRSDLVTLEHPQTKIKKKAMKKSGDYLCTELLANLSTRYIANVVWNTYFEQVLKRKVYLSRKKRVVGVLCVQNSTRKVCTFIAVADKNYSVEYPDKFLLNIQNK